MWLFSSARIRITLLYFFTTAIISGIFSFLIYRLISQEFERNFHVFESRAQAFPPGFISRALIEEDLEIAKKGLLVRLIYMNGFILTGATLAGYFLADRTLKPIEEVYEDQKRFIGDASHELRTPLTVLRSEIEVALRDRKMNIKNAKELFNSNLDEVVKMQDLVNYLLELNRYGTTQGLTKTTTNVSEIVKNVVGKMKIVAENKKLELKSNIKPVSAKIEPTSFEHLVMILLDNAIKYSDKGNVVIGLNKNRNNFELSIADSGIGISKSDQSKIFDRFYRSDESRTKAKQDGFGLGLSIAKTIVDLHKGQIWVRSKLGRGSTFYVKIPLTS